MDINEMWLASFPRTGRNLSLEYATVIRIESDQRCCPVKVLHYWFNLLVRSFVCVLSSFGWSCATDNNVYVLFTLNKSIILIQTTTLTNLFFGYWLQLVRNKQQFTLCYGNSCLTNMFGNHFNVRLGLNTNETNSIAITNLLSPIL